MSLVICVRCSHSVTEHVAYGCLDLLDLSEDGYPEMCSCTRTRTEVYRQHVPPVGEPATEARAGEGENA